MRPGDPARTGTVDIKNTGSLSGVFKLKRGAVVDSDSTYKLSTKLNLVVKDCGSFPRARRPATPATTSSTPARSPR